MKITLMFLLLFVPGIIHSEQFYQIERTKRLIKENGQVVIYSDKYSKINHFCPSGYMGDYGDIKIDDNYGWTTKPLNSSKGTTFSITTPPHSGKTCIQIVYSSGSTQGAGWAGVYWQTPPNNWGNVKDAGYNLAGAKRLSFWVRGEHGGEFISEFKVGGIAGSFPDSDSVSIMDITLSKNWQRYEIDLSKADLSYVIGGFCVAFNLSNNPNGFIMYLDDIIYEFK